MKNGVEIYLPGEGPDRGMCVKVKIHTPEHLLSEVHSSVRGALLNISGWWPGAEPWPLVGAIPQQGPLDDSVCKVLVGPAWNQL